MRDSRALYVFQRVYTRTNSSAICMPAEMERKERVAANECVLVSSWSAWKAD